jgi:hypothetical protein
MTKLVVIKKQRHILKAMSKITKIPSEINYFFSNNRKASAICAFTKLLESFTPSNRYLGGEKRANCQLTNMQVFQILMLLPFVTVLGVSHFHETVLHKLCGGKKDIFYSFMAQDNIDWRGIIYRIAVKLIKAVTIRADFQKSHLPAVLIADDSDLPKTGRRMEMIGKIFSHVQQRTILGYKMLMLCWSDGRSQFALDASLHGEKGKGQTQGMSAKHLRQRYSRERDEQSPAALRQKEYFMSKGAKLIEMVQRAIKAKIHFEYLLVDSWFTCRELVEFVSKSRKKFHLLGMAKMSNTKYSTKEWGDCSAKAILKRLQTSKSVKYSRRYRCHYASIKVTFGSRDVKLFFCRMGRNEKWRILLTTNTALDFMKAYEIYAMRWAIEVFFADGKRLLELSECHAQDFSSQIAHISLIMIRYNFMSCIKRSKDYETMGGLFKEMYDGVHELTVVEQIWKIILEVVAVVAELTGSDDELMLRLITENNGYLRHLQALAQTA